MAVKTIAGCDVQKTKAFGFVVTAREQSEYELSISFMTSQDGFVHYGVMYNSLDRPVRVATSKLPTEEYKSFDDMVGPFTKDVLETVHHLVVSTHGILALEKGYPLKETDIGLAISETLIEMFGEMGS